MIITREWLYQKYITENLSRKTILKELGISKSTFHRKLKKFNLSKEDKLHYDEDWLKERYLKEDLSITKIAKIANTSKTSIKNRITELGFEKSKKDAKRTATRSRRETNLRKYGTEQVFSSEHFRTEKKKTMLERYGCEHSLQNNDSKEKYHKTMMSRYGVSSPLQSTEFYDKYCSTMISRYGVSHPLKNKKIVHKMVQTTRERYGVDLFEKNISDKLHTRLIDGLTLKKFAEKNDISYTTLTKFLMGKDTISREEVSELIDRVKSNVSDIEHIFSKKFDIGLHNRKLESFNYRPDFAFSNNFVVNVDGLYWHSEKLLNKEYHFNLRKKLEKIGVTIFQFRADEILDKRKFDIVSSIVQNKLGNSGHLKIYARKCKIHPIEQRVASDFLEKNHLMGSIKSRHLGLFENETLVSVFSYTKRKNILKVDRFCSVSNSRVLGGFSKLLSFVEKKEDPAEIRYWVDLRYGRGDYLENFGFVFIKDTPGWKWTDFNKTFNRLRCRANMDSRNLSQKEHARELKWVKIYDAGQRLFARRRR